MIKGRPKIWTDDNIKSFLKEKGSEILMLESPKNVKSIIKWRCGRCGLDVSRSFDDLFRSYQHNQSYECCSGCREVSKIDEVGIREISSDSISDMYISGVLAAKGHLHPHCNGKYVKISCRPKDYIRMDEILRMIGADVQLSDTRTARFVLIRNPDFYELFKSIPKYAPRELDQAKAWIRGYFDMKGSVEMYEDRTPYLYRLVITGHIKTLESILNRFHHYNDTSKGVIKNRLCKGRLTHEIYFTGTKSPLAFLKWVYSHDSLPKPDEKIVNFIRKVSTIEDIKMERQERISIKARRAASYLLKSKDGQTAKDKHKYLSKLKMAAEGITKEEGAKLSSVMVYIRREAHNLKA